MPSELLYYADSQNVWLPLGLSELDQVNRIQSALEMLQGILPRDELEGMLAVQMVATHHAAVECLRRAMLPGQTFEARDQNLKHAAKLLGLFSRQLEGLDKHRGKGQQKVTVEHVYVGSGGQAIVGNVETGGNDVVQHEKCPASVTPNPMKGVPLDGAKFKPVKVCPKP